jgi:HIRAN domain-containing protein
VIALEVPTTVTLERERTNPHDPNAVLVRDGDGGTLGYVAREIARAVAPLLDAGLDASAELISRTGDDPGRIGTAILEIRLTITPAATNGRTS